MTPRTPEQNKEIRQQTRQQIIGSALELFAESGYANTSISAIAKKAGVSKGLIYHYFDSKESILEGIYDQWIAIGNEVLDFPEDYTAADKIRQVLEYSFQFIKEQTGMGRLMVSLTLQPDIAERLKPKFEEVQENQMVLYINILEELGYENPELKAYHLGALMDGILLGYVTMGDDYPFEKMKQKIMEEYVPS